MEMENNRQYFWVWYGFFVMVAAIGFILYDPAFARVAGMLIFFCLVAAVVLIGAARGIDEALHQDTRPEPGWLGSTSGVAKVSWIDFLPIPVQEAYAKEGKEPSPEEKAAAKAQFRQWAATEKYERPDEYGKVEGLAGQKHERRKEKSERVPVPKYEARNVPASKAAPEVLVDVYSIEYIRELERKMKEENQALEVGNPGDLEINE